ncbi:inner membrane protein [Escherichia coli]|uniref:Inner membrane protein n=1 Tax=Escherichia coli TaxID=562 RepID=A0A377DPX1_ECOLX|nr:inner membrane protein [Escherichia coli]
MTVVCCLPSNIYYVWVSFFYGFRLTFSQIADVGISGIIIDVLTLSSTFLLACFLGQKVFGLDKHTSWLIGAVAVSVVLPRYWRLSR